MKTRKRKPMNAFQKAKERRKQRESDKGHGKHAAEGWRDADSARPRASIPTEPDMELPLISKSVLVYEMVKAKFTDLDISEQTGLSWDEIKRLKAGGKREYQRLIDEHIKKLFWQVYQNGYEEGVRATKEEEGIE